MRQNNIAKQKKSTINGMGMSIISAELKNRMNIAVKVNKKAPCGTRGKNNLAPHGKIVRDYCLLKFD